MTKEQLNQIRAIIESGRTSGKTGEEIAAELNKTSVKPKRSPKWTAANVSSVATRIFGMPRKSGKPGKWGKSPSRRSSKHNHGFDLVEIIEDLTTCNLEKETKRFLITLISEKIAKGNGA